MLSIAGYFSLLTNSIRKLPNKTATDAWARDPTIGGAAAAAIGQELTNHLKTMFNAVQDAVGPVEGSIGAFYARLKTTDSLVKLQQTQTGLASMATANPEIPLSAFAKHWKGIRIMVESINEDYARVTGLLLGIHQKLSPEQWKQFYSQNWNAQLVQTGDPVKATISALALMGDDPSFPPPPPEPVPDKELEFGDFKIDLEQGRGEYELPNGDSLFFKPTVDGGIIGYSSDTWMTDIEHGIETFVQWVADMFGS